jgi:diaminohydroxyphosphoribosylaminopyrimidine deaminase/5-amino-6-(5-phosphoribosylamino)uracil reductase
VVATIDPNQQVKGRGIGMLRAAGIEVAVGTMQPEARALNDGFARYIQAGQPLVTLKAALSSDGMLAPPMIARTSRQTYWLTGTESRDEVHRMRHASDAILTGIGTVLIDDPMLTDRSGLARRRPLLRVVLDTYLRIPLNSRLVKSAQKDLLIFCGKMAAEERVAALTAVGVTVVRVPELSGRLDLGAMLTALGARHILSVLVEGGSQLNGELLAHDCVDKVVLFYAPIKLGENAIPFAAFVGSPFLLEQSLDSVQRTTFGEDRCVSGVLRDPWG